MEDSPAFPSKNGGTSKVDLPLEFKVLETCQKFVCKCLESEASTLEQEAYPALNELSVPFQFMPTIVTIIAHMEDMIERMLSWDIITPFGSPVVPLEREDLTRDVLVDG
ncbi:hypothetical protein RHMOL_Rhmol01G0280100 [Rhododendron molle]|uniref:Uncharacterized protein n=1 Tax=Rhododendron molle TaxID=49168 RepID=A0ACC0Q640_RHOML|nr:hypothetical protein RHMOL_Rhmol01G0280100 [Rhododendron molle]